MRKNEVWGSIIYSLLLAVGLFCINTGNAEFIVYNNLGGRETFTVLKVVLMYIKLFIGYSIAIGITFYFIATGRKKRKTN